MGKVKEPGKRTIKHFKSVLKKQREDKNKLIDMIRNRINNKTEEKTERNEKEEERLNEVGLELSKKFSYSKLSSAAEAHGGFEVHGFMQKTYIDYEWLINNFVLDRACFYAKRDYSPEIIKLINEVDIAKYQRSVIETPKEIYFENYPQFPFSRIIVYSKEPLEKEINWIDEYPWELDGYDTNVNLGPANVGLLGWATWNIPVILILHAPGRNQAFFEAKTSAKSLKDEHIEQLKSFLYQYRTYVNVMEEKIGELEMESMQYQRLYSDLKRTVLSNSPISSDEEFRKFEKANKSASSLKRNKKTIIWGIVLIVLVAVIFILVFQVMNAMNTLNSYTNSTISSSFSTLKTLGGF